MYKVCIKSIEVYHPEKVVDNNYYIQHFSEQGKDITRLLEAFGRDKRYIATKGVDTALTLGLNASHKALESANLSINDIDIICFVSQCPEYTFPAQSIALHGLLGASEKTSVFDMNVNCAGMVVAFDNLCNILKSKSDVNRALLVGSDCISYFSNPEDEYVYPLFGDASCAVVLEKVEDDTCDSDIICSNYRTDGKRWNQVTFPDLGSSISNKTENLGAKRYINWKPFKAEFVPSCVLGSVEELLEKSGFELSDINSFCYSQYAKSMLTACADVLNAPIEKFIYIGDKYGYTGVSSPFIALYEGIKAGKIKRGDLVDMWTIGVYWSAVNVLLRY